MFRKALFTPRSIPVLASLTSDTVISLNFIDSKLHFKQKDDVEDLLDYSLFPKLQLLKFKGAPPTDGVSLKLNTINNFVDLFMIGCQLRYFEVSYGIHPYCSGPRNNEPGFKEKVDRMAIANSGQYLRRSWIFHALHTIHWRRLLMIIHFAILLSIANRFSACTELNFLAAHSHE